MRNFWEKGRLNLNLKSFVYRIRTISSLINSFRHFYFFNFKKLIISLLLLNKRHLSIPKD